MIKRAKKIIKKKLKFANSLLLINKSSRAKFRDNGQAKAYNQHSSVQEIPKRIR